MERQYYLYKIRLGNGGISRSSDREGQHRRSNRAIGVYMREFGYKFKKVS